MQGDKGPIGVLTDNESPVKSIDKALNPSSWNMPQVFTVVTVARGLMEFADLFLLFNGRKLQECYEFSASLATTSFAGPTPRNSGLSSPPPLSRRCSGGASLMRLQRGDSGSPLRTTKIAFATLRVNVYLILQP